MTTAELILEYLKVFLSAPMIAGAVAFTFLGIFRRQIGGLIDRAIRIKFPGGELSASQQTRLAAEASSSARDALPVEDDEVALPPTISLTEKEAGEIAQLIRSERSNATLWEYRYLNLYLVRGTQMVLDWLSVQPQPVSLRYADSFWLPVIPSASERTAILNALQAHHLVAVSGDSITVTEKGFEYRDWRGPLPTPAPPTP